MSSWWSANLQPRIAACSKDSVVYVSPRNVRWADLRTQCHCVAKNWESERSISRSGCFAVHPHNPAKRGQLGQLGQLGLVQVVLISAYELSSGDSMIFALVSLPTINIYQHLSTTQQCWGVCLWCVVRDTNLVAWTWPGRAEYLKASLDGLLVQKGAQLIERVYRITTFERVLWLSTHGAN